MTTPKPVHVLMDCNAYLDEEAAKLAEVTTPDVKGGPMPSVQLPGGVIDMIGALPGGMGSGLPSVMIAGDVDGHGRVFVQCSMKIFLSAAAAFAKAYPEVLKGREVFAVDDNGHATVIQVPEGHVGVIGTMPAGAVVTSSDKGEDDGEPN